MRNGGGRRNFELCGQGLMLSRLHLHVACKPNSAARLASVTRALQHAGGRRNNCIFLLWGVGEIQMLLRDLGCECERETPWSAGSCKQLQFRSNSGAFLACFESEEHAIAMSSPFFQREQHQACRDTDHSHLLLDPRPPKIRPKPRDKRKELSKGQWAQCPVTDTPVGHGAAFLTK